MSYLRIDDVCIECQEKIGLTVHCHLCGVKALFNLQIKKEINEIDDGICTGEQSSFNIANSFGLPTN